MSKTPCPDAETLAAWVDHGVTTHEHAHITAHVAACDDCRSIVASVLHFHDETVETLTDQAGPACPAPLPVVTPTPFSTSTRTRKRWLSGVVGGGLVAAAAVLLAIGLEPEVIREWQAARRITALVRAANGERTVEARLTGGFPHGPLRTPVRAGGAADEASRWPLLAAAGEIREEASTHPSAVNLHGLGVAALVLGEYDEAIRALEDAVSEEPENGRYQSDLAAAYLARAQATDRPEDLTRALTAVERALKADPTLIEARFNRALTLERLSLSDQARVAWQEYLQHDADSPWRDEVQQHLQTIPEVTVKDDQAKNNSPPKITESTVGLGLQYLIQTGLPRWAAAVLTHDLPRAAEQHRQLLEYAESISRISGDAFAVDVVKNASPTPTIAKAVQQFSEGIDAVRQDSVLGIEQRQMCASLHQPLRASCDLEVAIDAIFKRKRTAGGDLQSADVRPYPSLRGRALVVEGMGHLVNGQFAAGLQPFQEAYGYFKQVHYLSAAGAAATQVADLLDLQGLSDEGWRWRLRGLELAAASGDGQLMYTTRVSTAGMLLRRGSAEAGRVFADAIGAPNPDTLSPLQRVVRERQRLRALLQIGDVMVAKRESEYAEGVLKDSSDFRAPQIRADFLSLHAAIAHASGKEDEAEAKLTEAIDAMGPVRGLQRASAMLARGTARATLMRIDDAEADIAGAIRLLTERAVATSTQALRLEDAPAAFEAVATLVAQQPTLQSAKGLFLLEELREALEGTPAAVRLSTERELATALAQLQANETLVYYLFTPDGHLLAWCGDAQGNLSFHVLDTSADEIERLVNVLTVQVTRAPERERDWQATLTALHQRVLHELPVDGRALVIVPDGVLNRVPFGALRHPSTGQFLFEQNSVRVAPNLAFALARHDHVDSHRPAAVRKALVIGEPTLTGPAARFLGRLPRAKREATAVAQLYPNAVLLTGADATKAHVLEDLPAQDVLHFAGHAVSTSTGSSAPRLLLAGSADDPTTGIAPADLLTKSASDVRVVLAACQTGATTVERSSGVALATARLLAMTANQNIRTVRATSPAFIARNASLISSRRPRRLIIESRSRRP
jgi:CHAT domain-containing protein